ncbi:hypothetical protein LTR60_003539, partial [Cryomyces antarcticus]
MSPSKITPPSTSPIPVVDFSPFANAPSEPSSHDQKAAAAKIHEAFRSVGFVYLTNHGVPKEKVEECFMWSERFFALPQDVKTLAPHPPGGAHHRGYSGLGQEKVSQNVFDGAEIKKLREVPDVKESFESGNVDDKTQPNIWLPENKLPGFRDFAESFFIDCAALVHRVLSSIALGLGLPATFFERSHAHDLFQLRLLHYPPVSTSLLRSGARDRIAAHSDFGTITLLFQDDVGGLEVEDPHAPDTFRAVTPVQGAVLVNVADLMMRWSNDVLRSTVHRVGAPPTVGDGGEGEEKEGVTRARYSIPFFATADSDAVIDCLEGCWSKERPK